MTQNQSDSTGLLERQRQMVRLMLRSHRFLMGHIISTVFGMYLIMFWVILAIAITNLPLLLLSIAGVIIILPILLIPLQYKQLRKNFGILQNAGKVLRDVEKALDADQLASGLTSYIFLIFDLLRPDEPEKDTQQHEIEQVRKQLKATTRKVINEICIQGFFFVLLLTNFLIPQIIIYLEQGGSFPALLVVLAIIIVFLIARWFVFAYWRYLFKKWLRFYQGFIEWGEELERLSSKPTDDVPGGGSP